MGTRPRARPTGERLPEVTRIDQFSRGAVLSAGTSAECAEVSHEGSSRAARQGAALACPPCPPCLGAQQAVSDQVVSYGE